MALNFDDIISKTRVNLLSEHPWFGYLAMRLDPQASDKIKTSRTDGSTLWINEEHYMSLIQAERETVFAQQIFHCAMKHPYRIGSRDKKMWNEACDRVANIALKEAGFHMIKDMIVDPRFKDMAAEQVYSILMAENANKPQGGQGQGQGGGGEGDEDGDTPSTGDFTGPSPEQPKQDKPEKGDGQGDDQQDGQDQGPKQHRMTEGDWEEAAEGAAMLCRKAGTMPASMDRSLKNANKADTDWRTILRQFIQQTIAKDYSWSKPNPRYNEYMPCIVKENCPKIVVGVDTSGSVDAQMLKAFSEEITAIFLETNPETLTVIYCDSRVAGVEEFIPFETDEINLKMLGGGGTAFQPVFDYVEKNDINPACLIYLTDLEGGAPKEPDYPTLWVVPEMYRNNTGFFGTTMYIDTHHEHGRRY